MFRITILFGTFVLPLVVTKTVIAGTHSVDLGLAAGISLFGILGFIAAVGEMIEVTLNKK